MATLKQVKKVAIGIYSDGTHIGIVYRDEDSARLEFLHFCWHKTLRKSSPEQCVLCTLLDYLEDEQQNLVIATAELIFENHSRGTLYYGFSPPDDFFLTDGNQANPSFGNGLTCATFVLATFHRAGVQLIKTETWPSRPSDNQWRNKILQIMNSTPNVEVDHVTALRKDRLQTRFHPLEVAGAAHNQEIPVDFATAVEEAKELRRQLIDRLLLLPAGDELDQNIESVLFNSGLDPANIRHFSRTSAYNTEMVRAIQRYFETEIRVKSDGPNPEYQTEFTTGTATIVKTAPTAELAFCRAALASIPPGTYI